MKDLSVPLGMIVGLLIANFVIGCSIARQLGEIITLLKLWEKV